MKFIHDEELSYIVGHVQASMRDRTYKVEVRESKTDQFMFRVKLFDCVQFVYIVK